MTLSTKQMGTKHEVFEFEMDLPQFQTNMDGKLNLFYIIKSYRINKKDDILKSRE